MASSDAVDMQTPRAVPLHQPCASAWLASFVVVVPATTLIMVALFFYTWERIQRKPEAPVLTTISEGAQAGWSYMVFSFGMTLFAMLFLINGTFYAFFLNSVGMNKWGFRRRCFMAGCTIFLATLCSLGLWMLGTFSWAYHGGIQCKHSALEKNFDLTFLHNVGIALFISAYMPYVAGVSASLVALHRDGMVSWPRNYQIVAAVAFCGAALSLCVFMSEVVQDSADGVSLQKSISQYVLTLCILVMLATLVIPCRGFCIQLVAVKKD